MLVWIEELEEAEEEAEVEGVERVVVVEAGILEAGVSWGLVSVLLSVMLERGSGMAYRLV